VLGLPASVTACLFDLDGVLTQTAKVHAAAWKRMFDGYLRERAHRTGEAFVPFDAIHDYDEYVDGKPRADGIRSFLAARGIVLPEGQPAGVAITRIGKRTYSAAVVEKMDPRGRAYYWIGGDEQAHENVPGSDCDAVFDRGLVSVTPLHLDLTQHALLEELRGWDLPGLVPSQ